jgi:hypothetical protein
VASSLNEETNGSVWRRTDFVMVAAWQRAAYFSSTDIFVYKRKYNQMVDTRTRQNLMTNCRHTIGIRDAKASRETDCDSESEDPTGNCSHCQDKNTCIK